MTSVVTDDTVADTRSMRIVVLDDDPVDRLLARRALTRAFAAADVTEIEDRSGLDGVLAAGGFDAFVVDYRMGWATGIEVLRDVKARYPDHPVVMFTGTGDEEIVVEAMRAGLDDYVLKSARHVTRLPAAVERALERCRQRQEARRVEERLTDLLERLEVGVFQALGTRVIACNPAFRELAGCSTDDEVRARALNEWLPAIVISGALRPSETRERAPRRQPLVRASGAVAWMDVDVALLADGTISGLVQDAEQARRVAREALDSINRERMRLAAEMHDGLGQQLAGLALLLASVAEMRADDPKGATLLARLRAIVADAQRDCRTIARGYAADVPTYGLRDALTKLAMETTTAGLTCSIAMSRDVAASIPHWVAHELYRIVQEAIANAVRHARATRVDVELQCDGAYCRLRVRDDGVGGAALAESGLGMRTMRYRAETLGGTVHVYSEPGAGTEVCVLVLRAAMTAARH